MSQAAYFLAVVASITYGAADFMGGIGARRTATIWVVAISQAAGLLVLAVLLPVLGPASPSMRDFAWGAVAGIAGGSGVALLYRALAIGLMSIVAPTTAVCAITIPVVVGFALGERPTAAAIAGILLAVVAIILVSWSAADSAGGPVVALPRAILLAIASGVLIGLFLVALERPAASSGLWPLLMARILSVSFFLPAAIRVRHTAPRAVGPILLITACGLTDMLSNVLYTFAVRLGELSIVATLTSLYPASTVILARIILHERLRGIQWAGVGCAIVAIVLIIR